MSQHESCVPIIKDAEHRAKATWISLLSIIYFEEPHSFTSLQDSGCPHGLCSGVTCTVSPEVTGNVADPATLWKGNCNLRVCVFSSRHQKKHRNLSSDTVSEESDAVSAKIKGATQKSRTGLETHKRSASSTLPHFGTWPVAKKGK